MELGPYRIALQLRSKQAHPPELVMLQEVGSVTIIKKRKKWMELKSIIANHVIRAFRPGYARPKSKTMKQIFGLYFYIIWKYH